VTIPKKKLSRMRRNMRRAHDFLTAPASTSCVECGAPAVPHQVCPACGMYRGRQVIEIESKEEAAPNPA